MEMSNRNHAAQQAIIMELKAVMKWISRLKSRDSAGSSLGTEQALITQLSMQ